MVTVRLVTVEGCPDGCPYCSLAEQVLRRVLAVAGVPLPEHDDAHRSEAHLSDGRSVEVVHVPCEEADDVDRAEAPLLSVDGETVLRRGDWDEEELARVVLDALFPDGWSGVGP